MRQIKFRAWDKKYNEMINDIHIAPEYDWLVLSDNDALAERDNRGRGDNEGYELMQFTGFLDKNGVEIYEGDIINGLDTDTRFGQRYRNMKVSFRSGEFGIGDNMGHLGLKHLDEFEVIGNIYQNPELTQ